MGKPETGRLSLTYASSNCDKTSQKGQGPIARRLHKVCGTRGRTWGPGKGSNHGGARLTHDAIKHSNLNRLHRGLHIVWVAHFHVPYVVRELVGRGLRHST